MKYILVAAVIAVVLIVACFYTKRRHVTPSSGQVVLKVLTSMPRSAMILATEEVMLDANLTTGSWLMGPRTGYATMMAKLHWGMDLQKLSPEDIVSQTSRVTVTLPEPVLLEVTPDLATWRTFSKRSWLQVMRDTSTSRSLEQELLATVQGKLSAAGTSTPPGLREAMLDRLNRQSRTLFAHTGLTVRFN